MRQAVAALLMVVLTLAGVGRGLALAAAPADPVASIAGVAMPICHAGAPLSSAPGEPGTPTRHDCCDECALCAPMVASGAPDVPLVAPIAHTLRRAALVAWTLRLFRARSPRQSQGPPAA